MLWGLVAFDYDYDDCLDVFAVHHGEPGAVFLRSLFKDKGAVTFVNATQELGVAPAALPAGFSPVVWYGIGARAEVFRAGDLGKGGAKPLWSEKAHADATPIHVGLGSATKIDLRVTFPGKKPRVVEHKGLVAQPKLIV